MQVRAVRLLAGGDPRSVDTDLALDLVGRQADAERAQPDAHLADQPVGLGAAGGAPDRWVRLLHGLGQHAPLGHRPVLALELVLVVRPAADDVPQRLLPHVARLVRIDAEALELDARGRAAGAEVDAAVGDQVEHGGRLGRAHRVVVGLRAKPHAVADS